MNKGPTGHANLPRQVYGHLQQVRELFVCYLNFGVGEYILFQPLVCGIYNMNKLAYNPKVLLVEEWRDIYLSFHEIQEFESLIDRLYLDLDLIESHKKKRDKNPDAVLDFKQIVRKDVAENIQATRSHCFLTTAEIQAAREKIKEVAQMRSKFEAEYGKVLKSRKFVIPQDMTRTQFYQRQRLKYTNPEQYKAIAFSKLDFGKLIDIFEHHLTYLEQILVHYYTKYVFEEDALIDKFVLFKEDSIRGKIGRFNEVVKNVLAGEQRTLLSELPEDLQVDIRTLYENLFIEADYLGKLVHTNATIFAKFEEDHENSFEYLKEIRVEHRARMAKLQKITQGLKGELREIFTRLYKSKKTEGIDQQRLEKLIMSEVGVNADQFQQTTNTDAFINGVFFAVLLFSLVGILVFRGLTLATLQSTSSYLTEFKIWRGASYLIFFNWVIGIVLFLFDYFGINYRLVLLESDTFVPKPQAFLRTAVTLSAIYLVLFLVYLFQAVGTIHGYPLVRHLGYFMWLINLCFLLNPLKIMNYEGRRYFVQLFAKVLVSIFRPMNLNIFLVAMIMGSFVQPFTDLAFTACSLTYNQTHDCLQDTRIATFVFTLVFITIRFGHSIVSHRQLKSSKTFTRPILGLIAVVCSLNNVLSSFLYNTYLSTGLLVYWIISAIIATFAGLNADIRADFGLISFDKEDCLLRKYKRFPRATYFIVVVIDFFLNIGWVFSVSNNLSFADSINPIYFLMVLSYLQLSRKGLWIFFRVEDDHSANVGTLTALLSDQHIYSRLRAKSKEAFDRSGVSSDQIKIKDEVVDDNQIKIEMRVKTLYSLPTLQEIQEEIVRKKEYLKYVSAFKEELADYHLFINETYNMLDWDDYNQ